MRSIASICALKFPLLLFLPLFVKAQSDGTFSPYHSKEITTAVPFLTIAPDARSGAMGDAGVAISPDANAAYWNPSKLAFTDSVSAVSLSYSPWLKRLISTANLSYLSYARKVDERNTLAGSVRYFSIGTVYLYDEYQNPTGEFRPFEVSVDGSLARKFGDNFSMG